MSNFSSCALTSKPNTIFNFFFFKYLTVLYIPNWEDLSNWISVNKLSIRKSIGQTLALILKPVLFLCFKYNKNCVGIINWNFLSSYKRRLSVEWNRKFYWWTFIYYFEYYFIISYFTSQIYGNYNNIISLIGISSYMSIQIPAR